MCTNKIEDFGQKIGGARKDLYQAAAAYAAKFATAADVEALTKAKSLGALVKLPNLESLTNGGVLSAAQACAVLAIWRTIDRKPSASAYRVSRWAGETAPKLAAIAALLGGEEPAEAITEAAEYRVLMAAGWPAEAFTFGRYAVRYMGCSFGSYVPLRIVGGGYYRGEASHDAAHIAAQIRTLNAADAEKRAEGPALAAYQNRAGVYYIAPDGKREICIRALPAGTSAAEVRRILREERPALLNELAKIKALPELRRDWNRPRVGQDWRGGVDCTPEHFARVLPFRGVEFGNWVTQTERAALLNSAFDGFHDLAAVLGLAPEAVTLSGVLAFAFASRGIAKAAAHYERDFRVINLTKKSGAGCMAHEWFHAVDHFAAITAGEGADLATETRGGSPLLDAARDIYSAIQKTEYFERSARYGQMKGDYWTKPGELAARAFEAVAAYLLRRAGICSDFLVNCLDLDAFTATDPLKRSDFYPYPTEAEAAALVPLYADFLRLVFGPDACRFDADTAADIAQQAATAARERAEAEARRAEEERAHAEATKAAAAHDEAEARRTIGKKAEKLAEEMGGAWFHVFASGSKVYAVGASASVLFVMFNSGGAGFYFLRENSRIKKPFRTFGHALEYRQGVDLRAALIEASACAFTAGEFFNLFTRADFGTYQQFRERWAASIQAEDDRRAAAATQETARPEKATAPAAADVSAAAPDSTPTEGEEAPHASLSLQEMPGGVYVRGDKRATLFNRRAIKAHGATWNRDAQRWEATEAGAVARLRRWFRLRTRAA